MAMIRRYMLVQLLWTMYTAFNIVSANYTNQYRSASLDALHSLQAAWNNTPDPEVNLKYWNASDRYPCWTEELPTFAPWRGVQCLREDRTNASDKSNGTNYHVEIVGLSLSEASLTGGLPAAIGDLQPLTTLILTGNLNLSGPIPKELAKLNSSLSTLDLHSNAFSGTIPVELTGIDTLRSIDLSDNQLTGEFPDWTNMSLLQTIKFSRNLLTGIVSHYDFSQLTELQELDLSNNSFNGSFPDLSSLPAIRRVNLSYNNFNTTELKFLSIVNCAFSRSLRILDLSGNGFTNPIPTFNRIELDCLKELYLDNNSFSGTLNITAITQNLTAGSGSTSLKLGTTTGVTNMQVISLKYNNIGNVIYSPSDSNAIQFRLEGNPYCSNAQANDAKRCFCLQMCILMPVTTAANVVMPDADKMAEMRKQVITIALSAILPPVFLVFFLGALMHRRSTRKQRYLLSEVKHRCEEFDVKPTIFTYRELQNATANFNQSRKLGQGGYGAVYKGVLPNSTPVAVKQLYMGKSNQGMGDFLNEMVLITGMRHRNLIKLKGCCVKGKERFLVYDFADNHDLAWVLLEGKGGHVSWPKRMNICLGVAHGLHYLHALADPSIIHRDIKASNILLDKNLEPKIADFGLALLFPEEQSHILIEHVAGTRGYVAPEYATLGQLSSKADVYSFGVLCLEIVAGRKNINIGAPLPEDYLTSSVRNLQQNGRLMDLVDPKLKLHGSEIAEAQRVIHTAILCLQYSEEMRPPMSRVVTLLQGNASSESDGNSDQPGVPVTARETNTGIPGFDYVPANGSTNESSASQLNNPYFWRLPSDSEVSQLSSASGVKLSGVEMSTSGR